MRSHLCRDITAATPCRNFGSVAPAFAAHLSGLMTQNATLKKWMGNAGNMPIKLLTASVLVGIASGFAGVGFHHLIILIHELALGGGVDPVTAVIFVVLNPLMLVHVVGGAHNDGLMALLAMLAVAAALTARPVLAGAGLAAAAAVKAAAALYAPFALAGASAGRDRLRLLGGLVAAAVVAAAVGLAVFGADVLEALGVAGGNQGTVSHWSVPATLARISGIDVDVLRALLAIAYAAAVVSLLIWVMRGGDWVRAAGWAAFGLLVASAYMAPWYLVWLLPLAAVSRDRALQIGAVAFTLFQVANGIP